MVELPTTVPSLTRPRRASWLWPGHQKIPSTDLTQAPPDPVLPSPREGSKHDSSRPSTPRRLSTASLSQLLSFQSSQRTTISYGIQQVYQSSSTPNSGSAQISTRSELSARTSGSFGKMAFNSMIGGLTSLSLSRTTTSNDEKDKEKESRGRSSSRSKPRSSSFGFPATPKDKDKDRETASLTSKESSRVRSQSPFTLRRFRSREQSPAPLPLEESDSESITSRRSLGIRPRNAFTDDADSGSENAGEDTEDDEDDWSDEDGLFDTVTERNTEKNAQIAVMGGEVDGDGDADAAMDPDPLGEGVNVVVPSEPYFPSTLNRPSFGSARGKRGPKKRKSKNHEFLPLTTSRPLFQRDRCTITLTHGHPESSGRRKRRYLVASDLSDESRYAVEWGIGTVLRDGDELLIVTVVENENKVDPLIPNPADRATKLRSQQERQGLAYILLRQVISLLQRTRLHVSVSCQAWHAKNARHMLLDIVDHTQPTMMIVGSRGMGRLKGVLLGSTSHYLIQVDIPLFLFAHCLTLLSFFLVSVYAHATS
ncbi:hypothetical protein JVT61DRAFT_11795 [Boletus reticuloceps]|uniref:UspA domain-containing protein n=1 Tax=Boletus reticuloceps TaxID=495285 RepID=A0A8I2YW94_9AGAM|nr:hypothetical protein JVT61DRAFT_11795 [Boletus reticuloceps]